MRLIERSKTFDNFIVGPCNRVAYAASMEAYENPGEKCNPLYIYGETGSGKTHLLMAILSGLEGSNKASMFISGRKSIGRRLAESIQTETDVSDTLLDCLLVDDIEPLLNSPENVNTILGLLESLERTRTQIVVTAQAPPRRITGRHSESLIRRISEGFIARILPLDEETRRSMIMNEMTRMNIPVKGNVLSILASFPLRNFSQIRMVLLRITSDAESDDDINEDFISKLLYRMIKFGELDFPEGFGFSEASFQELKPEPTTAPTPEFEKMKEADATVPTPSDSRRDYFDEMVEKFDDIAHKVTQEMPEEKIGEETSKTETEAVSESGSEEKTGLIEEWGNEEDRLVKEE
ncbi:MAG: DnaA ATPase domain-containing protein [Candidatus Glassbacteria bacterium]